MRSISLLLGFAVLIACGCSKSESNPAAPTGDQRGTPLGSAGTFEAGASFVWSAATNEILGTGTVPSGGGLGLVAMNALLGSSRVLDDLGLSLFPAASASGNPVYYQVLRFGDLDPDTMEFRRIDLPAGESAVMDACQGLCLYLYTISGDGAWLGWSRNDIFGAGSDSIVIEHAASGARPRIAPGRPVLMSPDGRQLLYQLGFTNETLMLHDRVTGSSTAFDLGLPASAMRSALRWDAAGVHALYLMTARELWVRHVATGVSERLYTSADTLNPVSATWSPDGSRVALWGTTLTGGGTTLTVSLHVVNPATKIGSVVAVADLSSMGTPPFSLPPGGIVFSPDSRTVAYQFEDQLFTSSVPLGLGKMTVRPAGPGAGRAALSRATPATPVR